MDYPKAPPCVTTSHYHRWRAAPPEIRGNETFFEHCQFCGTKRFDERGPRGGWHHSYDPGPGSGQPPDWRHGRHATETG